LYETKQELHDLQQLIDSSMTGAGEQMRAIFHPPKETLSARQISKYITGIRHVSLATVTANSEPRVAPVDTIFIHGKFYTSTDKSAFRARHLIKRPQVSVCYFEGDDVAIIVHGKAQLIEKDHPDFEGINKVWVGHYGSGVLDWSDQGLYVRINPEKMFTHARDPKKISRRKKMKRKKT
jgi:general stress protein 26